MDGADPPDVLLLADALPVSGLGRHAAVNLTEVLPCDDASFESFVTTSPTNATDTLGCITTPWGRRDGQAADQNGTCRLVQQHLTRTKHG